MIEFSREVATVAYIAIAIVVAAVAFFLIMAAVVYARDRWSVRDRYGWLSVIDRKEWKTAVRIKNDMIANRHRRGGGYPFVVSDLIRLQEENLLEARPTIMPASGGGVFLVSEFRLSDAGVTYLKRNRQTLGDTAVAA